MVNSLHGQRGIVSNQKSLRAGDFYAHTVQSDDRRFEYTFI